MTKRTKIVLGVGAAVVAGGVAWWLWRRHAGASSSPESSAGLCVEGEDGTFACGGDPGTTRTAFEAFLDLFHLDELLERGPRPSSASEDEDWYTPLFRGSDGSHVSDGEYIDL